jgi:excisionase family DNA binding protein
MSTANSEKERVFTSGEVAAICGVSPDTVSRWFDLGQIEGYRLGSGGDRRIPYENLRRFMVSHGIPLDRLEQGEKRILVVDDDPFYLDIIPQALQRAGDYDVCVASTGFDAGALVVERTPHLLILDIHLSDMDGRMVCQRVKSREETRITRVLGITGFLDEDEAAGLAAYGFDDCLRKPFSIAELTERVKRLLEPPAPSGKVRRVRKAPR